MKQLLIAFAFFISISSCKKMVKEELLTSDRSSTQEHIDANIQPAPPYTWKSIGVPIMSEYPNNSPEVDSRIIQVNGNVYCLIGYPVLMIYKFNTAALRWELFNDVNNIFSMITEGYRHLFSYGNKMYFSFQWFDFTYLTTFCAVDASTGAVTYLATFPGKGVSGAACFIVGNKGYVLGGHNFDDGTVNQLYEYDFAANQWINKGNSPLGKRADATALVIDNKVYLGMGVSYSANGDVIRYNDWKVYYPGTGYSGTLASFPIANAGGCRSFMLNGMPYAGFGQGNSNNYFYRYNPSANTWTLQQSLPNTTTLKTGRAFTIGNVGYLVSGALYKCWRFSNTVF